MWKLPLCTNISKKTSKCIPIKDRGIPNIQDSLKRFIWLSNQLKGLAKKFSRFTKMMYADYEPSNIKDVEQMCDLFNLEEQHQNMEHIRLKLRDAGFKQIHD
jgi:hypothetical protein